MPRHPRPPSAPTDATRAPPPRARARARPRLRYEPAAWALVAVVTVLACADRFTTNVWPRQTHRIGAGFAGGDRVGGLIAGPWSVKFYDVVARVSGRYSIVALNVLLFTMMRSFAAFLSESRLARHVLDMTDVHDANLRLHKWNGIALSVMTLVHVWSILMPPVFNGWKAQVLAGSFEWILSERKPPGFKDINAADQIVSLQVDDVFRIVEMTLLLAILMPLSIRWLSTRWHLGIHVHRLIAVLYFIDIVRRHTHPHSWFLNTPFFVAWLVDKAVGVYWRRHKPEIFRLQLSDDYMLLFWNQLRLSNTVGPKYYLRLIESSLLEHAHTFTGFENRRYIDLASGRPWSSCLLIRVYHNKRRVRLGRKDKVSHTQRVAESTDLAIHTWGPFHGSMSENARLHLQGNQALTMVAGGSAAGYLIDAIQFYKPGATCSYPLTVLYTCRDVGLFQWVVKVVSQLLTCKDVARHGTVQALIAVTDGGGRTSTSDSTSSSSDSAAGESEGVEGIVAQTQMSLNERFDAASSSDSDSGRGGVVMRVKYGRINFVKEIGMQNVVFFQGSGGLQRVVGDAARMNGSRFVAGPAFDHDASKKRNLLQALRRDSMKRDDRV